MKIPKIFRTVALGLSVGMISLPTDTMAQSQNITREGIANGVLEMEGYIKKFFNTQLGKVVIISVANDIRYLDRLYKSGQLNQEGQQGLVDMYHFSSVINDFTNGKYKGYDLGTRLLAGNCITSSLTNYTPSMFERQLQGGNPVSNQWKLQYATLIAYDDKLRQISGLSDRGRCRNIYIELNRVTP